jgi:opacity protein-like surface antigen
MKPACWMPLAASLLLAACGSTEGLRGRLSAGGGVSRLTLRDGGSSDSADGGQQSVRAELAQPIGYLDGVEVGLRLKGGSRAIDDRFAGSAYELDTRQFALTPTVRSAFALADASRVYVEAFAGYEYFWGDVNDAGNRSRSEDGGLAYGAGLGVEFDVTKSNALLLGLEWSRVDTEEGGANASFDDFSAIVGWAFRF